MRRHLRSLLSIFLLILPADAWAGQSGSMPGVENSVGYLASGTSIQPKITSESSPMIHGSFGNWSAMLHGNAFLVDVQQSGPRGKDKLFSTNWMMPMLHRQMGRSGVLFRVMFSAEPLTVNQRQYPLLFQTGETAYGLSIIDGQHPHDLLMEIAGRYDFKFNDRAQFFVYGGPVAEAALGPTAFPHRASASENPLATLGHHQEDSTHIASNVVTMGFADGPLQLEASTFHGREPDENRWNIDSGKPDSFATRLTIAPTPNLTAQISTGRINSPELTDLRLDTVRTTASLHHNFRFSAGHVSSSLIWGRNKDLKDGARRIFNSYGFELTAKVSRNWVWMRIENVDRDRSLLPVVQQPVNCRLCGVVGFGQTTEIDPRKHVVLGPGGTPITIDEDPIGRVQAFTLGYERELPFGPSWLNAGLGVQGTTYRLPSQLQTLYGRTPATVAAFLRIRPSGNMAEHMKLMHQRP